ncbi:MAG: hypothetical protein GY803_15750, partial [Chloroflexi bacterium]|nr:hypothetical protein [Chloroflexota bacterium]
AVAITLNNLGELASATADYQQSLTYHLESLQDFQAIGQMRGQMYALNFLGGVSLALGLDEDAANYYCQALKLAAAREAAPRAMDALYGLAGLEYQAGNYSESSHLLEAIIQRPATEKATRTKAQRLKRKLASALSLEVANNVESNATADWREIAQRWLEKCP